MSSLWYVDARRHHLIPLHFVLDSLANYARKPDCFRRVAGAIRTRCEDLEMNEDERVHGAAIVMYHLSIITKTYASYSCYIHDTLWIGNSDTSFHSTWMRAVLSQLRYFTISPLTGRMCRVRSRFLQRGPAVSNTNLIHSALSRSAQFWSSYSGYLREVRAYGSFTRFFSINETSQLNSALLSDAGMILVDKSSYTLWPFLIVSFFS